MIASTQCIRLCASPTTRRSSISSLATCRFSSVISNTGHINFERGKSIVTGNQNSIATSTVSKIKCPPCSQFLSTSSNSSLLFKNEGLEYHILTKKYRDEVLMVLARAFCTEPVVETRGEHNPEHKATIKDWVEFVDYWMDHCSSNDMSVVCLDPKDHRVAGAFIVRDLLMVPPGFEETYSSETNVLTPWMQFLWHLDRKATEVEPGLGETGAAVDLWFLGVHPDYRGRRIATHMTGAVVPLIRDAGYKFGTIEATSYFTSCAAKSSGFAPIYDQDVRDFEWNGEKPYANGAKEPHGTWTFWVKKLQE